MNVACTTFKKSLAVIELVRCLLVVDVAPGAARPLHTNLSQLTGTKLLSSVDVDHLTTASGYIVYIREQNEARDVHTFTFTRGTGTPMLSLSRTLLGFAVTAPQVSVMPNTMKEKESAF